MPACVDNAQIRQHSDLVELLVVSLRAALVHLRMPKMQEDRLSTMRGQTIGYGRLEARVRLLSPVLVDSIN